MSELIKNKLGLEILTDTGWQSFDGIVKKGVRHTITVKTVDYEVTLTPDHKLFLTTLEKIPADELKPGDEVYTLSGPQKVISVKENCLTTVYDIVNAGENKRFYADNILCSNCEFIIADETLISPAALLDLEGVDPISKMGQVRWYEKPRRDEVYLIALDPSLGTGGDPAGIQIYSGNGTTQVGEWRHNKTPIPQQIKLIAEICDYIFEHTRQANNIYYSIENNSAGEGALISLTEYGENRIKGIFMSEPGKKRKGFTTTRKSKLAACAKFKTLIETKKMRIRSKSLISELKTFVARDGSYAAKVGETDDLVMSSLLVVRMLQQLSSFNAELEDHIRDHDDYIAPLPFFAIIG